MADQQTLNEPDPEVIKLQMDVTRESLTDKLETLENKVTNTVAEAQAAVADTVEAVRDTVEAVKDTVASSVETVKDSVQSSMDSVKDTVSSSVDSVKDALDVYGQVDRHPWAMVGGSVVVGFLGGWLLTPARRRETIPTAWSAPPPQQVSALTHQVYREEKPAPVEKQGPSWMSQLSQAVAPELDKLKGMAIGTLAGVVRDMVTEIAPPSYQPQVKEMMDDLTVKMGGQPIVGRVLPESPPQPESRQRACAMR